MKVKCCLLASLILLTFSIYSQEENKETKNKILSFVGVSHIPKAKWSFPSFLNYENEKLKLSMDRNDFTTYDANIRFEKIKTVLGFSLTQAEDKNSNKTLDYAGHIGFQNMFFRVMSGKISGSGEWTGLLATQMPKTFTFSHTLRSYDVLFYLKSKESKTSNNMTETGMYIGLGHTKGALPVTVRTLITTGGKENQKYGNFVYDKDYSMEVYSFLFGFDTIGGNIFSKKVKGGSFNFYATAYDRIGFGKGIISDDAKRYAEELNPGKTLIDSKSFLGYLENNSSLGFSWTPSLTKGKAILALGYNVFFNAIFPFGGGAEKSTELGHDANTGMFRHGPELRFFAIW